MSTKDIVDERRRLEYIVDHCKFETPEQVTELFEAYTHLIWKYKQVGRIYDFYYDGMMIHREGNNDLIGVDQVVKDTLACLAAFPDMEFKFYDIHGTGNPEEGFRFGQAVYFKGTFLGVSKYGQGTGAAFAPDECVDICECLVKRVDGKWRVVEEWGGPQYAGLRTGSAAGGSLPDRSGGPSGSGLCTGAGTGGIRRGIRVERSV